MAPVQSKGSGPESQISLANNVTLFRLRAEFMIEPFHLAGRPNELYTNCGPCSNWPAVVRFRYLDVAGFGGASGGRPGAAIRLPEIQHQLN